jgi:multidrug efflux pump subunit AcrA (membrane-fusion protein)
MKQAEEEQTQWRKKSDEEYERWRKQLNEDFAQWRKESETEYERQRLVREQEQQDREAKYERERRDREAKWEQERLAREQEQQDREAKWKQERLVREQEQQEREAKLQQDRQKRQEEFAQWQKEMNKRIGQIGRTAGTVVEEIIASRLWEKFSAFSYGFEAAFQYVPVYDTQRKKTLTDIDILLFGDTHAMAVEVKSHLELEDVNFHIWRMGKIGEFPPAQVQGRVLLGAVGGANIDGDALVRAQELGFFVIELSGDAVRLAESPPDFVPKEWTRP